MSDLVHKFKTAWQQDLSLSLTEEAWTSAQTGQCVLSLEPLVTLFGVLEAQTHRSAARSRHSKIKANRQCFKQE